MDITDRKNAEQALKESEAKFRSYIQYSPDGIFVTDEKGRYQEVNPAACAITGYSEEELLQMSISDTLPEEAFADGLGHFQNLLNTGYSSSELLFRHKSGEIRCWSVEAVKLTETRYLGFTKDITNRKDAEHKLQESEQKLRSIFDTMEEGLALNELVHDENGRIIDYKIIEVNRAYEAITAIDRSQVVGKLATEVYGLTPEFIESFWKKNPDLIQRSVGSEYFDERGQRWFHVSTSKTSGNLFSTIFFDMTERKNAEAELRKLSQAVEQSPAAIVICDLDGNIEYVNAKVLETTGFTRGEVIGKNPRIWGSGEKPEGEYGNLWATISSGKIWHGEFNNKKKSGELYWESATISPIIDENGNITHYLAVKEDITERKRLTTELIQAKEHAEESDRLKSAFLANVGHEIRTPLNGIMGFSTLLSEENLSNQDRDEFTKALSNSCNRLLDTVTDVLEISKIDSGQVTIKKKHFFLNSLINELFDSHYTNFKSKNIQFTFQLDQALENIQVQTDEQKIYQILNHLLKNAYKFTLKGSVDFGVRLKNGQLEFYVNDTGIGIAEDQLDFIFGRFNQEDLSISRGYEGTGLGLAISKGLVALLDGTISVTSQKNVGSTFYFTVPFKIYSPESTEIGQRERSYSQKEAVSGQTTFLVGEDEITNFLLLQRILKREFQAKVLHARNGLEAIELIQNNPTIDLVLMDIKMPRMGGFEATRKIKEFADIPIIAVTACATTEDLDNSIEAGCEDYIAKPYTTKTLVSRIRKLLYK